MSLSVDQINEMYNRFLSELGLEKKGEEIEALALLKANSRLLAIPKDDRFHTALFKYLLLDLKDACLLAATQSSKSPSITASLAMKVVSAVSQRTWFERVFAVLKSSEYLMSVDGTRDCLFDLLWNPRFEAKKIRAPNRLARQSSHRST